MCDFAVHLCDFEPIRTLMSHKNAFSGLLLEQIVPKRRQKSHRKTGSVNGSLSALKSIVLNVLMRFPFFGVMLFVFLLCN
jgi:hypothetical protein